MAKVQHQVWRMLMPVFVFLLVGGGIFVSAPAQPIVAADNGIPVSTGAGPNHRPSINISPDNSRVCVVWTTFGNRQDQAYVRLYTPATGGWSPDLNQAAFNVSRNSGGSAWGNSVRCTIDAANRTHVVWMEQPGGQLRHSMLASNADAANAANWTQPITIVSQWFGGMDTNHPDIASLFADASGEVWLTYWSVDAPGIYVRAWTPTTGWGDATQISGGGIFPRIAVDNAGYVHVIFKQEGGIRYAYRDAANGQWTSPVQLPGSSGALEHTGLAVNRDTGDVHAVFSVGPDFGRVVKYVKKHGPTGTSFSGPIDLTGAADHHVARIAWSESGKLTAVVDERGGGAIVVATSDNNGASWSGANTVASAPGEGWPSVTMDDAGNSYIAYWNKSGDSDIYFVQLGNAAPAPTTRFADVPTSYWAYAQIEQFATRNITTGCGTDERGRLIFCPDRGVTRAEMAVFIDRTLGYSPVTDPNHPQTFADVPKDYWAYGFIERFVDERITTGCGTDDQGRRLFCPDRGVTRAEMAVFIDRAKRLGPLDRTPETFADVPQDYWAYGFIERFVDERITTGCGTDEEGRLIYCPDRGVTRAEMAVFIIRAFP